MKFYSTNNRATLVSFKDAIFKGLPDDNGLFMPEHIPVLPTSFFDNLSNLTLPKIGLEVLKQFVGNEIPENSLEELINDTFSFDIPLVQLSDSTYSLELFHGPTYAFKDVGARFLARSLSHFIGKTDKKLTVLVATSGDTGSAVAQGFYDVPNIDVVILYPKNGISDFQEYQMTSLGKNITALEVDGAFDDCQALVKKAFLDKNLSMDKNLTSANSINIARLLPQSIYYFYAFAQATFKPDTKYLVSVPSGNYGNLTAGLIAQRMGLPIHHFLACSNSNNTVPSYLQTSKYEPKPSVKTISNAMDVGDPSNFARMLDLFDGSHQKMKEEISGFSYSDIETRSAIKEVYNQSGYILDPHGAVGYLGLQERGLETNECGIFLETAHPYKFKDSVEPEIGKSLTAVEEYSNENNESIPMENDYTAFKDFLMSL
ncbi:MAG: threonine synthase [Balneola sp.]